MNKSRMKLAVEMAKEIVENNMSYENCNGSAVAIAIIATKLYESEDAE